MKHSFIKSGISLLATLSATLAFAHGEDKPGPHGGIIRMPGAFHTELILSGTQQFEVYLLDMNWENPSVKNSSLSAEVQLKTGQIQATCKADTTHYVCELPRGQSIKLAQAISLKATREQSAVGLANYTFQGV